MTNIPIYSIMLTNWGGQLSCKSPLKKLKKKGKKKMSRMFLRNSKYLKERLAGLKEEEGFDSLHLPGGTSKDGKHSSFVVAWYYDRLLREKFLLVLPYKSLFYLTEKKDITGEKETPLKTAVRELKEETGIHIPMKDLKLFYKSLVGSNTKKGDIHVKYFFHYTKSLGINQIPEDFFEGLGEVSSPFFIKETLVKHCLFPGHYAALR